MIQDDTTVNMKRLKHVVYHVALISFEYFEILHILFLAFLSRQL